MKTIYEAPSLEVVEVRVEKGFAASDASLENPLSGGDFEW